jgi:carboxyl-terminal processing protease
MRNTLLTLLLTLSLNACTYGQGGPATWNIGSDPAARKLNLTLSAIEHYYVDSVNRTQMTDEAIVHLLQQLDPHSGYLTPEEVKQLNEPLQGNFDGIGIQFNMLTDTLYVAQVITGGPSERVGLLPGDRILQVNDTLIAGVGMKNTDIVARLRGPRGTTVKIQVKRKNELIPFTIERDKIPIYSLDATYMIDKETGYISLNRFAETTATEFRKAFTDLRAQGMQNLILDLQDNSGGYLESAVEIASEFLKRGSLIVYTEGLHQKRRDAHATTKGAFTTGRLIVLINEASASASEIVTGALQDWDRAVIVGRRSFGKGLVQNPLPLPDGSVLKLTTARYYTPSGRSIQKPYERGKHEAYHMEVIDRYTRGELTSPDSIQTTETEKYTTLTNHRTVYGGGGITPDLFVPADTSLYTNIHRKLTSTGTINRYAIQYIDHNREKLRQQHPTFAHYQQNFTVNPQMIKELLQLYTDTTHQPTADLLPPDLLILEPNDLRDLQKSAPNIQLQLKALIAGDLWDTSHYYQIINQRNTALQHAIPIITDPTRYNTLLGN